MMSGDEIEKAMGKLEWTCALDLPTLAHDARSRMIGTAPNIEMKMAYAAIFDAAYTLGRNEPKTETD